MRKTHWSTRSGDAHLPLLLAFLLLGFFLRSFLLDRQSLWGDEAYTFSLATRAPWQAILDEVLSGDPYTPHTPLYYLALAPWLKLAGSSDFILRWFSVAFGLLMVPASYVLARRLTDARVACLVALLAGLSPFLVYYSQEARMYAMAGFLATLTMYFFIRGITGDGSRWWIAYSLSAIALFFTLNIGLSLVAVLFLASLWPQLCGERNRNSSLFCHLLIGLSIALWQIMQSSRFQMVFTLAPLQATGLLGFDALKDTLLAHNFGVTLDREWAVDRVYLFRNNPLQPWAKVLQPYYTTILAAAGLGLASLGAWKLARARSAVFPLVLGCVASVFLSVLLLRLVTPGYAVRLTLIASPLFLVLLATGILALPGRLRPIAIALILVVMSYSLWQNYQNPAFSRGEYRVLARYLAEEMDDGDAVYLHGPVLRLLDSRYLSRPHSAYHIPGSVPVNYNWGKVEDQLKSLAERHSRLWLVLGGDVDYDPDHRVERWLLDQGYQVDDQWYGNSRLALFVFPRHKGSEAFAGQPVGKNLNLMQSALHQDNVIVPGQSLPVSFTWKLLSSPRETYRLSLRILDAQQVVWAQRDVNLGPDLDPVRSWPVEQPVVVRTGLRVPPGTPPGQYFLKALVYESKGRPLPDGELEAVPIRLTPGPLGPKYLRPPNRANLPLGPLRIVGYQTPGQVRAGGMAAVKLFWEAPAAPAKDYSLLIRLGTGPEQVFPLIPEYPTSTWRRGEALISQHLIRVPPGESGRQAISVGLVGQTGTQLLPLTEVEIARIERNFQEPAVERPHRAGLGDRAELLGMELRRPRSSSDVPSLNPGESLSIALYWKALREMQTSYTVFVQLLDAQGRLVVTEDTPPVNGDRPTTGWLPGEILRDQHALKLPESIPPGRYSLITGMYNAATGERLRASERDFVHLMDLLVRAE